MSRGDFRPQMSRLILEKNEIGGAILIQQTEDALSVGWLQVSVADKHAVLHLLQDAVTVAAELVPGDTRICFLTQSEAVERLAEKLVAGEPVRWKEERWPPTIWRRGTADGSRSSSSRSRAQSPSRADCVRLRTARPPNTSLRRTGT